MDIAVIKYISETTLTAGKEMFGLRTGCLKERIKKILYPTRL